MNTLSFNNNFMSKLYKQFAAGAVSLMLLTSSMFGFMTIPIASAATDNNFTKLVIVDSVNGNTINAKDEKGDTMYDIDTTDTKIIRENGSKSSMDEISAKDRIRVYGHRESGDSNSVKANKIRNFSVVSNSVFTGILVAKDGNSLQVKDPKNVTYTIVIKDGTKYWSTNTKKWDIKNLNDLKIGDTLKVRGLKDTQAKTLKAEHVKVTHR